MTVRQLIEALQAYDMNLPVCYRCWSEHILLTASELKVKRLQPPRPDGWVHAVWTGEPALRTVDYLVFPGN